MKLLKDLNIETEDLCGIKGIELNELIEVITGYIGYYEKLSQRDLSDFGDTFPTSKAKMIIAQNIACVELLKHMKGEIEELKLK